jgi:hypothetical protein
LGDADAKGFALATANGITGYVDTKYVVTASGICDNDTWRALMDVLNGLRSKESEDTGDANPDEGDNNETEVSKMVNYTGTVKTNRDGKISLWKIAGKSGGRYCYIYDGEPIEILGEEVANGLSPATAKGYVGFADADYVINRTDVGHPETADPADQDSDADAGILIPTAGLSSAATAALAEFVGAIQKSYMVGDDDENFS